MLRRLTSILFVSLSVMLLAACGAGASTPATTSNSSTQSQATSPSPTVSVAPTTAPEPTQASAPTEAPSKTPEPTAGSDTTSNGTGSGASCLVGTWQFQDMSAYLSSVLSKTSGVAQYVGQEGTVLYTFGSDGKAKIDAQNFKANLKITASNISIPMAVNMTGSATADYTTSDPNKVTFSNSNNGDFKFSVTINGQESSAITGDQMAFLGMSPDPKYDTFTYECSADTLRYTPPVANAQPVVLKRVTP
jgi:hypothetical protein